MTIARYEHARVLVEGARDGPESLDPALQHRLCHAAARLECLADLDTGTPREREQWVTDTVGLLAEADTLATHDAIRNTIRDARQLLEDPVICQRATRIHSGHSTHLDDRAVSKWFGPAVLLATLALYCVLGLLIAGGGVS